MQKTTYEWDIETVDKYGDVYDHDHRDRVLDLHLARVEGPDPGYTHDLVLVRDVWVDWDLKDRTWAYTSEGCLPSHFRDCDGNDIHPVPKRFFKELALSNRHLSTD